jgi:tetratricopeptide (TPR) repeat protein
MEQRRITPFLLMLALSAASSFAVGCSTQARSLALPEDPLQLTIVQRTSEIIPGSNPALSVRIDDVTGGQVLVEVLSDSELPLVNRISMRPGDAVRFPAGGRSYYLTLIRLNNFLFGGDFAVFEVSARRPSAERKEIKAREEAVHEAAQSSRGRMLSGLFDALSLYDRGMKEKGTKSLRQGLEAGLEGGMLTEGGIDDLGCYYLRMGMAEPALEMFRFNAERFPNSPRAHTRLGKAWVAAGRPAEAEARFRRALELDPGFAPARTALDRLAVEE